MMDFVEKFTIWLLLAFLTAVALFIVGALGLALWMGFKDSDKPQTECSCPCRQEGKVK